MARIKRFYRVESQGTPQPTEVECAWRAFDSGGARLLQLDTFGSKHRMNPNKQSQTLQLDKSKAAELIAILELAFSDFRNRPV